MRKLLSCVVFLVACGSDSRSSATDASSPDPDGGSGLVCGGFASVQCPANELCDYPDDSCGVGDQAGRCRPRPANCPAGGQVTCGCDNQLYASACPMQLAGTDFNAHGSCTVARGAFACGYTQCDLATQYCRHDPSAATSYACVTLPAACSGARTCGCLAGERCGTACTGDAGAGLTATCR